jgi:UDP-2,3-diacylglucosamine hydrolase
MGNDTIYFISDAHIGAPFLKASEWEQRCIEFFQFIRNRACELYILGDLFDFWIEYHYAIRPDYFRTIHELKNLVENGINVHYFAGNHDFALGPFLTDTVGIKVYPSHKEVYLQGKHVYLYHGDGLIAKDRRYRILKGLLRNPVLQKLYKLLPPAMGIPLGSFCSGTSRTLNEHRMIEAMLSEYRDCAKSLLDQDKDIVFFAHTHEAELSRWGQKMYCNTGAWMRTFNFATLKDGMVRLWIYRNGYDLEELPAIDRK